MWNNIDLYLGGLYVYIILQDCAAKDKILLVFFTAKWAAPCMKLEPAWQKIASEHTPS